MTQFVWFKLASGYIGFNLLSAPAFSTVNMKNEGDLAYLTGIYTQHTAHGNSGVKTMSNP